MRSTAGSSASGSASRADGCPLRSSGPTWIELQVTVTPHDGPEELVIATQSVAQGVDPGRLPRWRNVRAVSAYTE